MAQVPGPATNFLTPEDYARLLREADSMDRFGQGQLAAPRHWTQALAGALGMGLGGYQANQAQQRNQATQDDARKQMAALVAGQGNFDAAMANPVSAQQAMQWKMGEPQREYQQWKMANERANAPLERQLIQTKLDAAKSGPKPQFTKIGTDAYGRSQYGWVTPEGVKPYSPPGGGVEAGPGVPPGISPELAEIVKQLPPRKRALFNEMVKTGKMDKAIGMLEEKPLPGDAAARIGMLRQTATVIPQLRKLWIEDAKERTSVGETANYMLGRGDVGEARRLATGAMEGILRAATGAAVTAPEEARYSRMFVPDPTDTLKTRRQKLDALERFSASIEMAIQGGRQLTKLEAEEIARKTVKGLGLPVPGVDKEENTVSDDVKKRADEILRKRGIIQ